MKKCVYCETINQDDSLFCKECGKPISQGCVCPHCSNPVNDEDLFCQNCGKKISEVPSTSYVKYTQQEYPYEVSRDKLHIGMYILCFVFSIIGFIYAFSIWKRKPSSARSAFYASIFGVTVTIVGIFALKYQPTSSPSNSSVQQKTEISEYEDAIIDCDWDKARKSKSKSALQLFIDRNPDNVHVREARMIIDSLDFETAKAENTMESYKKYLEDHEQGYYYDEARSAYDRLEEEMIRAAQLKAEQDSLKAEQEEKSQEELAKTNTAIGAFDVKGDDSE